MASCNDLIGQLAKNALLGCDSESDDRLLESGR